MRGVGVRADLSGELAQDARKGLRRPLQLVRASADGKHFPTAHPRNLGVHAADVPADNASHVV